MQVSRLVPVPNPQHPTSNNEFVEVKGPSGWGLLCVDSFNRNAASVVCRENRHLFIHRIRRGTHHDGYEGLRYRGMVECAGDEEGLNLCSVFVMKVESCPKGDALVDCTAS